jgi:hypothetical protein
MQIRNWRSPNTRDDHPQGPRLHRDDRQVTLCDEVKQWQTPSSGNFRTRGGDRADELGLDNQAKKWATPQAHDVHQGDPERVGRYGTEHGARNLTDEVMNWPTAKASDANGSGKHGRGGADLRTTVSRWKKLEHTRGR